MPNPQLSPALVRDKIILPVLEGLGEPEHTCVQAMELLLGTAATESHMGLYLRQLGGGPALGLWQIEPDTEWDVWNNYLSFRPELRKIVQGWQKGTNREMEWNHSYSCAIARLIYKRVPSPLPPAGNLEAQAHYWKNHFNTRMGKGTVEKYMKDWHELVEGKI